MTAIVDKQLLRKSLIDLTETEPDFVRELMIDVDANLKKQQKHRLEDIVNEDFKEYAAVFKALA